MPSSSERDPWLYVEDMLGFAERVMSYSAGVGQQAFFQDPMRCDATLRNLELLGEAATRVPAELRARHSLAAGHRDPQPPHPRLPRH